MKLTELWDKSILILGFGVEGLSTYKLLRELLPGQTLGIADVRLFEDLPPEGQELLPSDSGARLHLGSAYLKSLVHYDVIIKTPGIPFTLPEIREAVEAGKRLTSHTEIFLINCPGKIVGVTGTKGKGTTSKLIHTMLKAAGFDSHLVGNIGTPPLPLLKNAKRTSYFVFELSAQQLEGLSKSPHVAVLLNIVPDHLDHFGTFEHYAMAKKNITLHQNTDDYLVYNKTFPVPREIAAQTRAQLIPFSSDPDGARCFIDGGHVVVLNESGERERIISTEEVSETVPGRFNLDNVLPAVAVARLLGVGRDKIIAGIKNFEPLANRFERVGTYRGITFYNASISTVPHVTVGHARSLGPDVETMLLGGFDRGIDFSELGKCIIETGVRNLILFPATGTRIWEAVVSATRQSGTDELPHGYFVRGKNGADAMREAVIEAFRVTRDGKICLHSPASPSFGLFQDYRERGELFKRFVREIGVLG